ncbi:hypothetical protein [Actinomadura violacea]|uniref:Uncharacterized protein n=1 Tax=Actinomadura violacea TaxID=2819934 RepID=A0ABS3S8N4_9ACTN|nr:hypothetical protein [Actinomadura violacea]MBO2465358.1 hypothetical protein [Actinomadura violacea]
MTHLIPDSSLIERIGSGLGILTAVRPNGRSEQALRAEARMFHALLRHVRDLDEQRAVELK